MMKSVLLGLLLFLTYLQVSGQILIPKEDYEPKVATASHSFAISLISGSHVTLTTYGMVRQNPDSSVQFIFLTFDTFIHQISGHEKSLANPNKINYLEEYGITINDFKNLWKLKFDSYPYEGNKDLGYGTKLGAPSKGQYELLKPYGISRVSDYCYGDKLWKLMMKYKDPQWVGMYSQRK